MSSQQTDDDDPWGNIGTKSQEEKITVPVVSDGLLDALSIPVQEEQPQQTSDKVFYVSDGKKLIPVTAETIMKRVHGEFLTETLDMVASTTYHHTRIYSGPKGTGKSIAAMCIGYVVVLDFEGSAWKLRKPPNVPGQEPRKGFFGPNAQRRIVVADFSSRRRAPKIEDRKPMALELKLEVDAFLELLSEQPIQPDWIVIDGAGAWSEYLELSMRMVQKLPVIGGVNWDDWKYRKHFADEHYNAVRQFSRCGVIICSHWRQREYKRKNKQTGKEETIRSQEPEWSKTIKRESEIVVEFSSQEDVTHSGEREVSFYATISSNKVTGQTGRVEFTNDPRAVHRFIEEGEVPFYLDD